MPTLAVHLLPRFVDPAELADSATIVVDLLRASTTICQALESSAECVVPFVEIDETLAAAAKCGRQTVLLGGERHGLKIDGFDLGNSPAEYTPEVVRGRRILFTTTNGARALHHAIQARHVYVGAAVNCRAVAREALGTHAINILCAGTGGEITREDILCAGSLVDAVLDGSTASSAPQYSLHHHAEAARHQWHAVLEAARHAGRSVIDQFTHELHDTTGGRNLLATHQSADIALCAQLNSLSIVPELNLATGEIRPA
jgi:2-phosphosulfolactate phosphatase